ncbi:MAG: phosphoribosylformylglycinamidine cyclo-ligase [Ignavibacteria bacterium]|nr:phosphoribosylformylglycinamidine cyclo-ligase [Ignavibacteria bacterium]
MITYKKSGVDVERGYKSVKLMKKYIGLTHSSEVLSGIGGFGSLYKINKSAYRNPVLVSGADGVGTKLKIAFELNIHDTIGIDCVAMCVNDILCLGAKPVFFLDYIACAKIIPQKIVEIVKGIAKGCILAGCSLVGGETAEMPGFYKKNEYDLAGFAVGIVEKNSIVDGSRVKSGNTILGIASSGLHSNGFSLVRKLFNTKEFKKNFYGKKLGNVLLTPTKIYVKNVLDLLKKYNVNGIAHITGGGFIENIPRAFKKNLTAEIKIGSWHVPHIFFEIKKRSDLDDYNMFNTFNMGIGLIIIVNPEDKYKIMKFLKRRGENVFEIGLIKNYFKNKSKICFV